MRRIITAGALALAAGPLCAEPWLDRGAYLVEGPMACGNCHTPMGAAGPDLTRALAGRLVEQSDQMTAIAPNLTPGGEVAGWSDAELVRAIREGVRPDGSVMGPPMPFELYHGLSDEDAQSVVIYLRQLPAVQNDPGTSTYRIPLPPAYGPPIVSNPPVPAAVTVEYGGYLANAVAHCTACHSPIGPQGPMYQEHLGAGGNPFPGPWGTAIAANITPTGLSKYSDAELATLIRTGTRLDGSHLAPVMPVWGYARMTDDDMAALILYLRALPPQPDWAGN